MRALTIAWLGLVLASAAPAAAADIAPVPPETVAPAANDWRFQLTLYGWLSGVDGDIGVRGLGPVKVDIPVSQVLSDLDGALMASFAAQNDDWLIMTDLILAKISSDGGIRDTLLGYDFSQTQITAQGLVGYKLPLGIPRLELSPTVGFRYQNVSADLGVGPVLLPISVSDGGTQQWIDPTVGLYAHYEINDRWFVNALGDVGGFGVGSKLTWQAFGAIGYNWTKTISTSLGYRAIYEDYENGGFVYDVTQQGVFAGLGIHF